MRMRLSIVALVIALTGVGSGSGAALASFATDQRIVYSDGLHSENTAMIRFHGRILLVFRGGEEGQIGSARARIKIFESRDHGRTFTLLSEVNANNLPGGRDIRDPKLVEMGGRLFLYAISRVPGFHYRDFGGQAWTVRAESADGGRTWSSPVRTYQDVDATGVETFWGFWRYTERPYIRAGKHRRTLFATGYQDGDTAVGLFASDDGISWKKRSTIIASYNDVPSEAELQFFGRNHDTAVALVRLDNQDILADGQTAICTSRDPFVVWECGRRIEQRLDGPTWADVDFTRAPAGCVHPPPEHGCEPPPLPADTRAFDVTGTHLLTIAPVIWPAQILSFLADAQLHGSRLDLALQPLDGVSKLPVGAPWTATDVAVSADGRFTADFGTQSVPVEAYPLLDDPLLTVNEFVLSGATISSDGFCGFVGGYSQVFGTQPSDRTRLEGSTFGAVRITSGALPAPVTTCPLP